MMRVIVLLAAMCSLVPAQAREVAVLPFFNLSGSPNLDWIGESVAETIRRALEREGQPVLDRESREEAYRRLSLRPAAQLALGSVVKLGRTMETDAVVYGSFTVSPAASETAPQGDSRLELTVRILDLREMKQEEPMTAVGQLQDLGSVQNRAAWLTLRRLAPENVAVPEEEFQRIHHPVRLDALENYIRGLLASSAEQKHRLFTQAARLDESFTEPYFELGRLQYLQANYAVAAGWLERVSAESANVAEAIFLLGLCRYAMADYEKAENAFRTVSGLSPSPEVWNNLGAAQSRLGKAEASDSFRRAMEAAPYDPVYRFNLGYALWKTAKFEAAAEVIRSLLDLTPQDSQAILLLGRCLNQTPASGVAMKMENFERIKADLPRGRLFRMRREAAAGPG